MVTVDPKLASAARSAQAQAAQRLIVLQATRAGMETLIRTGDAKPSRPIPPTPPEPERATPDLVARAVTTGAAAAARHLPGDAASAYAQTGGDVARASGREVLAPRPAADSERLVAQPRAESGPPATIMNGATPAQGLVGIALLSRRVDASEDGQGHARSWSLKWWGPSANSSTVERRPVPLKSRLAIAVALVLLGLILASML